MLLFSETSEVINLDSASQDPRYDRYIDGISPDGNAWGHVLCLPLIRKRDAESGSTIGVVQVCCKDAEIG